MTLRVLQGGRSGVCVIGGVAVEIASASPLAEEARVFEEDTYLVLSASPEIRPVREHPIRTMTAVWDQEPEALGSIVEARGPFGADGPGRWLAVVHDLGKEPTAGEDTVSAALDRALALAKERGVKTLGMELLGAMHGALSAELALELLSLSLSTHPNAVARIVLHVPDPLRARVEELLRESTSEP